MDPSRQLLPGVFRVFPREPLNRRPPAALAACAAALLVAACGGGGGGGDAATSASNTGAATGSPAALPASRNDAARFLTQATFGPTDADTDRVMALGYSAWLDEQFTKTAASSHRADWDAADAVAKAADATATVGQDGLTNSVWKQALTGDDALRERVAFALSELFVVSLQDSTVGADPRGAATYLDTLAAYAFGNFRDLLQAVTLHPSMGIYLSSLHNQKADNATGRVPDENYAREVMQLFTIGLHELNADGSEKLAGGLPIDTYTATDISGIARVFTGWSWSCANTGSGCFFNGVPTGGTGDPDKSLKTMTAYPAYHSTEQKKFLTATIPVQTASDPAASLKIALDTLFNHPNVGPFIGRQLIQRLVTSNPSPAYVAAVSAAFADNGSGVRGDMKAVWKAVLLHPEARSAAGNRGKVREPVLKVAALMRAFPHTSDSGFWRMGNTDNPGTALGQTPMRSASVFNFFRPGYVPPGTLAAGAGLAVPEMQIASETTAAGAVNFVRDGLTSGFGTFNSAFSRRDLQAAFTAELALADQSAALVDRIDARLCWGTMPAALKTEIQGAVEQIAIPALAANGSNAATVAAARRTRVNVALLLAVASPEFQVQK